MTGILDGVLVLDLSRTGPGQWCTSILADFGARVIAIEDPRLKPTKPEMSPRIGRNKESVLLDLRATAGREIFLDLVQRADVLMESFRPGVTKRLGIDYASLAPHRAGLIYCSLSSYGQSGPYADLAGWDLLYQAMGAFLRKDEAGKPIPPNNNWVDQRGAMHAALGIVLALLHKARTGDGQYLETSFLDAAITLRLLHPNNSVPGGSPDYDIYQAADGKYVAIGCGELPSFWNKLCEALGRDDLRDEIHKFGSSPDTVKRVRAELQAIFATRPANEWFEYLKSKDVGVAIVADVKDLGSNPQVTHLGGLIEERQPSGRTLLRPPVPVRFSKSASAVRSDPPVLGQHTRPLLREFGIPDARIEELIVKGVVA